MPQRKNANKMTTQEVQDFKDGVTAMIANGSYAKLVAIHGDMRHQMHSMGTLVSTLRFLPWHRAFVLEMEKQLVALKLKAFVPWWDWLGPGVPAWLTTFTPTVNGVVNQRVNLKAAITDHARIDMLTGVGPAALTDFTDFTRASSWIPTTRDTIYWGCRCRIPVSLPAIRSSGCTTEWSIRFGPCGKRSFPGRASPFRNGRHHGPICRYGDQSDIDQRVGLFLCLADAQLLAVWIRGGPRRARQNLPGLSLAARPADWRSPTWATREPTMTGTDGWRCPSGSSATIRRTGNASVPARTTDLCAQTSSISMAVPRGIFLRKRPVMTWSSPTICGATRANRVPRILGPTACSPLQGPVQWRQRLQSSGALYIFLFGNDFNSIHLDACVPGYVAVDVPTIPPLSVFAARLRDPSLDTLTQPITYRDMTRARLSALSELSINMSLDLAYTKLAPSHVEQLSAMIHLVDLRWSGPICRTRISVGSLGTNG